MAAGVSHVPHPGSHNLPISRSAQAAAACDALPDPQQALLGLGDRDVSSPLWWPPGWLPATEVAMIAPGTSGTSEPLRETFGGCPPLLCLSVLCY